MTYKICYYDHENLIQETQIAYVHVSFVLDIFFDNWQTDQNYNFIVTTNKGNLCVHADRHAHKWMKAKMLNVPYWERVALKLVEMAKDPMLTLTPAGLTTVDEVWIEKHA